MRKSSNGIIIFILLISTWSCIKRPGGGDEPTVTEVNDINELVSPTGFSFQTSYTQAITIEAANGNGQAIRGMVLEIYTQAPENGGDLITKGFTNAQGELYTEIQVPAYKTAVYALAPNRELVSAQRIELNGGEPLSFRWGSLPDADPNAVYRRSGIAQGEFSCEPGFYQSTYLSNSSLTNIVRSAATGLGNGQFSVSFNQTILSENLEINGIGYNTEDNYIYGFLPSNGSLVQIDNQGAILNENSIQNFDARFADAADFDGSGNLVAAFYDGTDYAISSIDVDASPLVANQSTLIKVGEISGNIHDIVYHPTYNLFYAMTEETKVLQIDAINLTVREVADFSASFLGNSVIHTGWAASNGDIYWIEAGSGDIYRTYIDGGGVGIPKVMAKVADGNNQNYTASESDGCSCPTAAVLLEDSDGDGVINSDDDFPEDSTASAASYIPSENGKGSYAFEDLWPRKGDFDLNDAVLNFQYTIGKDQNNQIRRVDIEITLLALGAGLQNGFGIQFDDLSPADIQSVSGSVAPSITTAANGCESGQRKAVIFVYDNGHTLLGTTTGKFVNTGDPTGVELDPVTVNLSMALANPQVSLGTVNPFIIVNGERGKEIHLKGFTSTDLVDNTLFNTLDDASSGNDTYQTRNGIPWGISYMEEYNYPIEKRNFLDAFPFFDDWVISDGLQEQNWYILERANLPDIYQR